MGYSTFLQYPLCFSLTIIQIDLVQVFLLDHHLLQDWPTLDPRYWTPLGQGRDISWW